MLGILIGITAVVLTVGLGQGAKAQVQDQINELGTNLLVISPGSSTSSSGVRGGFGSASTLTVQDADALRVEAGRARRRGGRAGVDHLGVARQRLDELDHDADRHDTELEGGAITRASRRAGSSPPPTSPTAAAVVVLGPDTASELFSGARPRRPVPSRYNGDPARGRRRARAAQLVRERPRATTSRSCRCRPTRSGWSVAPTATRSARSTSRRRRRTRCRRPTRRATRSC